MVPESLKVPGGRLQGSRGLGLSRLWLQQIAVIRFAILAISSRIGAALRLLG